MACSPAPSTRCNRPAPADRAMAHLTRPLRVGLSPSRSSRARAIAFWRIASQLEVPSPRRALALATSLRRAEPRSSAPHRVTDSAARAVPVTEPDDHQASIRRSGSFAASNALVHRAPAASTLPMQVQLAEHLLLVANLVRSPTTRQRCG